jgi:hypothetical protein
MANPVRRKRPKTRWGQSNNTINFDFQDFDTLASIAATYLGKVVPTLQELQEHVNKLIKDPELLKINEEKKPVAEKAKDSLTAATTTKKLTTIQPNPTLTMQNKPAKKEAQRVPNQTSYPCSSNESISSSTPIDTVDRIVHSPQIKTFFTKMREIYKENYEKIVQIFVDTLQVKIQIDNL